MIQQEKREHPPTSARSERFVKLVGFLAQFSDCEFPEAIGAMGLSDCEGWPPPKRRQWSTISGFARANGAGKIELALLRNIWDWTKARPQ